MSICIPQSKAGVETYPGFLGQIQPPQIAETLTIRYSVLYVLHVDFISWWPSWFLWSIFARERLSRHPKRVVLISGGRTNSWFFCCSRLEFWRGRFPRGRFPLEISTLEIWYINCIGIYIDRFKWPNQIKHVRYSRVWQFVHSWGFKNVFLPSHVPCYNELILPAVTDKAFWLAKKKVSKQNSSLRTNIFVSFPLNSKLFTKAYLFCMTVAFMLVLCNNKIIHLGCINRCWTQALLPLTVCW